MLPATVDLYCIRLSLHASYIHCPNNFIPQSSSCGSVEKIDKVLNRTWASPLPLDLIHDKLDRSTTVGALSITSIIRNIQCDCNSFASFGKRLGRVLE